VSAAEAAGAAGDPVAAAGEAVSAIADRPVCGASTAGDGGKDYAGVLSHLRKALGNEVLLTA